MNARCGVRTKRFCAWLKFARENTPTRINHGLILASLRMEYGSLLGFGICLTLFVALTQMGHQTEAREALLSWFIARPVGLWSKETRNMDYQISVVRYYGDGSEEADYSGVCKHQTLNSTIGAWHCGRCLSMSNRPTMSVCSQRQLIEEPSMNRCVTSSSSHCWEIWIRFKMD